MRETGGLPTSAPFSTPTRGQGQVGHSHYSDEKPRLRDLEAPREDCLGRGRTSVCKQACLRIHILPECGTLGLFLPSFCQVSLLHSQLLSIDIPLPLLSLNGKQNCRKKTHQNYLGSVAGPSFGPMNDQWACK